MGTVGMGGVGTGMNSSEMYGSGKTGMGANMSGLNMPRGSESGTGSSGVNPHGLNYAPPVEGSYLRSLGIQI